MKRPLLAFVAAVAVLASGCENSRPTDATCEAIVRDRSEQVEAEARRLSEIVDARTNDKYHREFGGFDAWTQRLDEANERLKDSLREVGCE